MSEVDRYRPQVRADAPFDIEETLRHSLGIDRSGRVETVELLFDPEVAGTSRNTSGTAPSEFGTADDGRLLLTMTVQCNPELEGKIRKWTRTSKSSAT
jgi:hypothetical protein